MPAGVTVPPPPRAWGRRWRDVEYAAIDFETTGLDLTRDTIVSYGVVPVRGGRATIDGSVHQLVDPHVPPSPRSQTIHELRPQDLAGSPTLDQIRGPLAEVLAGRYLLVWYAEVEVSFLTAIFGGGARRWRRRTIDVRNLAIAADREPPARAREPGYGLSATAGRYGVPVANAHEAYDDALVTAQLFLVLVTKLAPGGDPAVAQLLRLGRP